MKKVYIKQKTVYLSNMYKRVMHVRDLVKN